MDRSSYITAFALASLLIVGCSPVSTDNQGSAALDPPAAGALGGVMGIGAAAALGASRTVIGVAGIGGAGLGYYLATLRFAARGIIQAGGKVYTVGDYVLIDMPTDDLFDTNTNEFLPGTDSILQSTASVLARYPQHNIIISGNTSGFGTSRYEKRLSEARAEAVASSLWRYGITNSNDAPTVNGHPAQFNRRLIYVGYGDAAPIANNFHLKSIRQNSHIQIIASPSDAVLHWDKCDGRFKKENNIGKLEDYTPKSNSDYLDPSTVDFNKEFPVAPSKHTIS